MQLNHPYDIINSLKGKNPETPKNHNINTVPISRVRSCMNTYDTNPQIVY